MMEMDPENSSSTDPESPTSSDVSFNTDHTSHLSKDDESSNIRRDEPKLPEEDEEYLDAYQPMVEVESDSTDTGTDTDEPKPTVPPRLLGLYNPIYDIPNPNNNILEGLRKQVKAEQLKRAVEKELFGHHTKEAELLKRAAENELFARRTKLPRLLPDQDAKKEATEARKDLELVKKELTKSETEKENLKKDANQKIKELEDQLTSAKEKAIKDAEDLEALKKEIAELKGTSTPVPVSELQDKIAQLEAEVAEAYQFGTEGLASTFSNALAQVAVFRHDFVADENILKPEYTVVGNKIVLLDSKTDQIIKVVYPAEDSA